MKIKKPGPVFYLRFARHLRDTEAEASAFTSMLDSPMRVILEIVPEKFITYDGAKMAAHARGEIDESQFATPLESDTVRFLEESRRRPI